MCVWTLFQVQATYLHRTPSWGRSTRIKICYLFFSSFVAQHVQRSYRSRGSAFDSRQRRYIKLHLSVLMLIRPVKICTWVCINRIMFQALYYAPHLAAMPRLHSCAAKVNFLWEGIEHMTPLRKHDVDIYVTGYLNILSNAFYIQKRVVADWKLKSWRTRLEEILTTDFTPTHETELNRLL